MVASKAATLATTVATNGMAVAQGALNLVMSANPIALVVVALGGLTAAFVTLWNKCDWFREKVSGLWDSIKSIFNNGIESLKKFMNFEWSLPKIKMPHFSISGKFSLNPPSIPKFSVDWYHTGAIFKNRTILPGGIGVGDKYKGTGVNAEAIVPLDEMYQKIDSIVSVALSKVSGFKEQVNSEFKIVIENFYNNREIDIQLLMEEMEFYRRQKMQLG